MRKLLALSAFLLAAAAAAPALASAAPAAIPNVRVSTAPPPSPATIYTAERLRDPFMAGGGSGGVQVKAYTPEEFNIHTLSLRGIMRDSGTDYALFSDPGFGVSFILRGGKLYDSRNKPVPGISGKLRIKEKWAQLETAEHDVQVFRLGEEEKE
jgi:Tfp pilus assembly protein PilP